MRPFDASKFVKGVTKSIKGMSTGFHDPDTWVNTGSYALNYVIANRFDGGIPLGKVVVLGGESGSGKSFLASGNIVREAQKQGIYTFIVDSENALDEDWLQALGVETTPDKMTKFNMAMIDDVGKMFAEFIKDFKDNYMSIPRAERPKVLFVVDSLGMLLTPNQVNQFEKGDMKGDMGLKAKMLKALVTNLVNVIGEMNVGVVATNHTYASQDMFNPDPVQAGGAGFTYAASIVVAMGKLKLKEDTEGNSTGSKVMGIRSKCKVMKTRYNKPFEEVTLKIPYEAGMDPYTGLFDLFEEKGLMSKSGNSYVYVDIDTGEEIKKFRKKWDKNEDGCLDLIMQQFHRHPLIMPIRPEDVSDEENPLLTDEQLEALALADEAALRGDE